jgi:hypothetical protein
MALLARVRSSADVNALARRSGRGCDVNWRRRGCDVLLGVGGCSTYALIPTKFTRVHRPSARAELASAPVALCALVCATLCITLRLKLTLYCKQRDVKVSCTVAMWRMSAKKESRRCAFENMLRNPTPFIESLSRAVLRMRIADMQPAHSPPKLEGFFMSKERRIQIGGGHVACQRAVSRLKVGHQAISRPAAFKLQAFLLPFLWKRKLQHRFILAILFVPRERFPHNTGKESQPAAF